MIRTTQPGQEPNNIRALRQARNMSMARLGELIGTDASTVNKLEKGRMQLTERWIAALVEALDVSPNDLLTIAPEARPSGEPDYVVRHPDGTLTALQVKNRAGKVEVRTAEVDPPAPGSLPANVPVLGTAAGSHERGAFALDLATAVDWVRRPPALHGAVSAYALYVEGTSMEPKYQPGDLIFVHPQRPARVGDIIIVQFRHGPNEPIEASIGTLKRRTEKCVVISKLNPPADIEIQSDHVIAIHKVLSTNDLFGV